jgi:hypothetical protein
MQTRPLARAILLLALGTGPLAAQAEYDLAPQKRLWVTLAGSVGSAGVSCVPKCAGDRQTGPAFLVRGAGQLSDQFAITLEGTTFRQTVTSGDQKGHWTLNWYLLGAMWFPRADEEFYINGAIGLSTAVADISFPTGLLPMNFSNLGATFGLGRDIRVRPEWAVTMYLQYHTNSRSQALIGRANSGARVSTDFVSAGMGITIF